MSNPLKVALIGANGQLGSDIFSHFSAQSDRYQITALTRADIQSKGSSVQSGAALNLY